MIDSISSTNTNSWPIHISHSIGDFSRRHAGHFAVIFFIFNFMAPE
jgi:hypothetical protein